MKEIILTAIVTAFTTATIMATYYHNVINKFEDKLMEERKKRVEN